MVGELEEEAEALETDGAERSMSKAERSGEGGATVAAEV